MTFTHIFPAQIRQTATGLMGANEHILLIPAQSRRTEAHGMKHLQQTGIKAKTGRSLDGHHSGHHTVCKIFLDLLRGESLANELRIAAHLIENRIQFPLKHILHRHIGRQFFPGGRKAGKELAIARQLRSPVQIDM